ncbi:hypothetical protein M407DRAFT_214055 [Tulasnella calospora MUT 4182]|uniref:Uncharacterized protein n=1 Tax=Tulasnella calospora MUT 4182 TaxID=1051891 RepID=A0A0C3QF62_9AGAM|nr:hypothetical protein M407DRAFT_214055 [Tulasnella calospora MUT 4182]
MRFDSIKFWGSTKDPSFRNSRRDPSHFKWVAVPEKQADYRAIAPSPLIGVEAGFENAHKHKATCISQMWLDDTWQPGKAHSGASISLSGFYGKERPQQWICVYVKLSMVARQNGIFPIRRCVARSRAFSHRGGPTLTRLGNGEDKDNCRSFVQKIRLTACGEGKEEDSTWIVKLAYPCFSGKALDWHASLPADVQQDWRRLERAILLDFPIQPTLAIAPPHIHIEDWYRRIWPSASLQGLRSQEDWLAQARDRRRMYLEANNKTIACWLLVESEADIPDNAIPTGPMLAGGAHYSARAWKGQYGLVVGKCDLLVGDPCHFQWIVVPLKSTEKPIVHRPFEAVEAGMDKPSDCRATFILQAFHNGCWVPGKVHSGDSVGYFSWGGREHSSNSESMGMQAPNPHVAATTGSLPLPYIYEPMRDPSKMDSESGKAKMIGIRNDPELSKSRDSAQYSRSPGKTKTNVENSFEKFDSVHLRKGGVTIQSGCIPSSYLGSRLAQGRSSIRVGTVPQNPMYLEAEDRSAICWLLVDTETDIPSNALTTGFERSGEPLYSARAWYNDDGLIVGKCGKHLPAVSLPLNGKGIGGVSPFEILVGDPSYVQWVAVPHGGGFRSPVKHRPFCAVEAGVEVCHRGQAAFICQAEHEGGWHPGKVHSEGGWIHFEYDGKEVQCDSGQLFAGVDAGVELSHRHREAFICQAQHERGLCPGKAHSSTQFAEIGHGGKEHWLETHNVRLLAWAD